MPRPCILCTGMLLLLLPPWAKAQSVSDAQAVAILTQALNASGATNPLNPVQDFTATGTITYFWAGERVQGSATIKARGAEQFRLDAYLPEGTRAWAVNRWSGALRGTDGNLSEIPLHNTINLGILTFPYLNIAAALNDPLTLVSYVGLADVNGRRAQQVRVQRRFASEQDPEGTLAKLSTTDYFLDPATGLLLKTQDMTHPNETLTEDLKHEVEFENHATVDRAVVPMLVRERIIGQVIWELRLTAVTFNAGLADADFAL